MSQRSFVEINHDCSHDIKTGADLFLRDLGIALRSGSREAWEALDRFGITFLGRRHHSNAASLEIGDTIVWREEDNHVPPERRVRVTEEERRTIVADLCDQQGILRTCQLHHRKTAEIIGNANLSNVLLFVKLGLIDGDGITPTGRIAIKKFGDRR